MHRLYPPRKSAEPGLRGAGENQCTARACDWAVHCAMFHASHRFATMGHEIAGG